MLPAAAGAAATCSFNSGTGALAVSASSDGQITLRHEAPADGGEILVGDEATLPQPCLDGGTPATGANTDTISVDETGAFGTTLFLFLDGGGFMPGLTGEGVGSSEIEISLDYGLGGTGDNLLLFGTSADDSWLLGVNGINFNAGSPGDTDVDISYPGGDTSVEGNQFAPGAGDDTVDGRGDGATGAEAAIDLRVFGEDGEDTLIGGEAGDLLSGDGGADTLVGRGDDDSYLGGPGDDILDGVTDAALIPDTLNYSFSFGVTVDMSQIPGVVNLGSDGVDTITGDFKTLAGSPGPDVLKGDSESGVTIRGQAGNDLIEGGTGDENLRGATGADLIRGGPGNDVLIGEEFPGVNPGDTVAYDTAPAGVNVDLDMDSADGGGGSDAIAGFANVIGSPFADTISGDAGNNQLTGGGGSDQVFGLAGSDTLQLRDGVGDTGDCGTDADSAVVDAAGVDTLIGCESVAFPATVAPQPDNAQACAELRAKLKKAKKRLKAAKRAGKPTKKKRKKVRKLKRELRSLGC